MIKHEDLIKKFPIGSFTTGKVIETKPFGIFLEIEEQPFVGFIPVIEFINNDDLYSKMISSVYDLYPVQGDILFGEILGYTNYPSDSRRQVWISLVGTPQHKTRLKEEQIKFYKPNLPRWLDLKSNLSDEN